MNAEHGEENVQVKAHAYRWVDRIWVKEIAVVRVRVFLAIQKN